MFIYWISGESGCLVSSTDASKAVGQKFITHADYRALEEASAKLDADFWRVTKQNAELIAELASIKARVGELVEAARSLVASTAVDPTGSHCTSSMEAAVYDCNSALEAFK